MYAGFGWVWTIWFREIAILKVRIILRQKRVAYNLCTVLVHCHSHVHTQYSNNEQERSYSYAFWISFFTVSSNFVFNFRLLEIIFRQNWHWYSIRFLLRCCTYSGWKRAALLLFTWMLQSTRKVSPSGLPNEITILWFFSLPFRSILISIVKRVVVILEYAGLRLNGSNIVCMIGCWNRCKKCC